MARDEKTLVKLRGPVADAEILEELSDSCTLRK